MENPFEAAKVRRPTLLMAICVLTFIGSGWGILSNLFSIFTAGMMNGSMNIEQNSGILGELEDQGIFSFLSGSMETLQASFVHLREISLCGFVLSVVSLVGAILMFRLRRSGFYFYTAAQILMLCVTPYFAGFSFLVWMQLFLAVVFSAIFIILYAVNLKYMR